jgi:hypothetical protein
MPVVAAYARIAAAVLNDAILGYDPDFTLFKSG